MALDPQRLAALSPAEFVSVVKAAPDRELDEDLGGEHREAILDAVFARFPENFLPEKAGDRSARIDFQITGGRGGSTDTYAVVVENGTCRVDKDPGGEPNLLLMMGPADFLKLVVGAGNPVMMFMTGKVKARGDLSLASALQNWFAGPTS